MVVSWCDPGKAQVVRRLRVAVTPSASQVTDRQLVRDDRDGSESTTCDLLYPRIFLRRVHRGCGSVAGA